MNKKQIIILSLLLLMALLLGACGSTGTSTSKKDPLVGTWAGDGWVVVFREDGTGTISALGEITWYTENGLLHIPEESQDGFSYKVSNDTFTSEIFAGNPVMHRR